MNPTTDRTNITDSGYTFGGKNYTYETRMDANNQPYRVDVLQGSTPAYNAVSPVVVSNENKQKQVGEMLNTVNTLATGRGATTNGETTVYADGSAKIDNYQEPTLPQGASPIYGTVNGQANRVIGYNTPNLATGALTPTYFDSGTSTPAETPEERQFNMYLDQIKASTDANTARQISSIESKFKMLKEQQKQINAAQEAGTRTALLTGGVTGKGSSSQYAPISSENIVAAQLNYGLQQIAQLDAQEQDLINEAQAAGEAQNFKILEKKLTMAEEKRKEKAEATAKLNEKIAEENAKQRETMLQSRKDTLLANAYSQGITDPTELLTELNKSGQSFTLKEVTEGLKNIVPPGLDDLVKTLRNNGAPQDVIQKVLSSGNINEAYKNAGNFAAGGTGIIGEYNFYRAQAEAKGLNPVDFNTYQNMDANRKARVAAAGVAKVGEVGTDGLVKVTGKEIQDINETVIAKNSLVSLVDSLITSIDKYGTQVLFGKEAGSRGSAKTNLLLAMKNLEKTGALDKGTIDVLAETIPTSEFFATEEAQKAALQKLKDTVVGKTDEYISSYKGTTAEVDPRTKRVFEEKTGDIIMKTEEQAKQAIDKIYPTLAPDVRASLKTLYEAEYTDGQVYEYLQLRGLI